MNVADVGVFLIFLGLAIVGVRRGVVGMCLLALSTLASFVVATVVAYIVSDWTEGSMAGVAAAVAFFLALALASWVLRAAAGGVTGLVHKLPFATVDRLLGALLAMAVGAAILSLAVLGITSVPIHNPVSDVVRAARTTPYLLEAGRATAAAGARHASVLDPLAARFEAALRGELRPAL